MHQAQEQSCSQTLRRVAPARPSPRSVLGWLPFFWQHVLFPGASTPADTSPRWWIAFVVLAPAVLLYPCMSFYLFEPDEGRYAQIPREMLQRGDWLVPYLQGEPYLDKPPLFYWLVMASYALFGFHDWAARLVPALAVHATILASFFFARRALGTHAAFWGALVLMFAPGFLAGRLLILDGLLTLWVALALCACSRALHGAVLHRGWWLLTSLACALGILTKGPIALILLVPPVWLHLRLTNAPVRLGWRAWLCLAAVVAIVNVPWYVAVSLREPRFAAYFFWEHNVLRFLQPFDHERPVWYFVPILFAGFLPAVFLGAPFVRFLLSADPAIAARRPPFLGYVLLAGLWCIGFFSFSGSKLPTYILPAFPPLALALGHFLAHSAWHAWRWTKPLAFCWFGVLVAMHYAGVPWLAHERSPMKHACAVTAYCSDPAMPVLCFPRNLDSVAFYLGRSDLESYRSKEIPQVLEKLKEEPRTVVLFAHRNSLKTLERNLPPSLRLSAATKLGLCDMAVVERVSGK